MKIIPLSEGAFSVDQSKQFIPFDPATDDLQKRSRGSLLVEIQPFVVITSRDVILLDTGLGFADAKGGLQIHQLLAKHDLGAEDVTKVLLSHLHKDHTGGIAHPNKKVVSFENATYYVNKNEWEFALTKGHTSYREADFLLLSKYSKTVFTEGDGYIDNYIRYEVTGAHCPYHQVFTIAEEGQIIFFGGDVAPQLQQMKNRFKAKYDFDGNKAMELRQQWWQQGQQEGWTFLFYHDIRFPVFSF